MNIIKSAISMMAISRKYSKTGKKICFVPTMGALHDGHISLIRNAGKDKGLIVVSIFVNPLQFGPREDYKRYPRSIKKDIQLLKKEKVDLLFLPSEKEMYCSNSSIFVDEVDISRFLCGRSRFSHFKGVCTVLVKLFNIVNPDIVYFGQKDYQQAQVVKRLVRDLMFSIKVKVLPTIREKNNLAISSRNVYLSEQDREKSTCGYKALCLTKQLIDDGQRNSKVVLDKVRYFVTKKCVVKIDYLRIVDPNSLIDVKNIDNTVLAVIAFYINNVRLIDNLVIKISSK